MLLSAVSGNEYMKRILGKKVEMTQFFDDNGLAHAATIVDAGPVTVVRVKTPETDGYHAIVVGYGSAKQKNVARAQERAWGDLGLFAITREFRLEDEATHAVGDTIDVSVFESGDIIRVTGTSKGKGFQGVVKRHGFGGGRRSHGQKHSEREPGSIG